MSKPLICHVVAGYPDVDTCLNLISKLAKLQIEALEVQIPFSDPIADGEAIMEANDVAIHHGMTIQKSFELLTRVREKGISTDIYLMSYIQKINHFGFKEFCINASKCNVKGFIIPDLPFDTTEYDTLKSIAATNNLIIVPVVSPGMLAERLEQIVKHVQGYIYVTSRQGITGTKFEHNKELEYVTNEIKKYSQCRIYIGFGIASSDDVKQALQVGDAAIIGSAIIRSLKSTSLDRTISYVEELANSAVTKVKAL
jgi:tryptophan synthase alpha chain